MAKENEREREVENVKRKRTGHGIIIGLRLKGNKSKGRHTVSY